MAIVVTFVDNADNTGGVATVAGSSLTATNTLYVSRFQGNNRDRAFSIAGTRVGDGAIAVPMNSGRSWRWLLASTGRPLITRSRMDSERPMGDCRFMSGALSQFESMSCR